MSIVPKEKPKSLTIQRMTKIFNEWAKRYSEDPKEYSNILDEKGNPVKDYGECCARYFTDLANEMDEKELLPKAE